ncbi:MAG: SMC-Scp complex subunit ScpB [Planctomycetota bacterium]
MADDSPPDAPHLLPFPSGEENGGDGDGTFSLGDGEDLETAYRRALAAVDAAEPALSVAASTPTEPGRPTGDAGANRSVAAGGTDEAPGPVAEELPPRVTPREVVEAALFVGGAGLTAERAGKLLRGTFTDADLASAVAVLNQRYQAEGRPYRAKATDDGYVLALRPEYEPLRRRLYGLGPREVTLPPDALETLSVVAYRQPISAADVERTRDRPSGGALRRLVRLGVLRLDKPPERAEEEASKQAAKTEPTYATTDRFLDLFGLGSLEDLPVPADLRFK